MVKILPLPQKIFEKNVKNRSNQQKLPDLAPHLKNFLKHVETFSSLVEGVSKYVVTYSKNILDVPITHFSQYAKKSIFLGFFGLF